MGALSLLLLAAVPSCDLETEPLGVLTTASFFQSEQQAVQATNATYNMLREWRVHVFSWLGLTDIASDDATKGSVPGDAGFLGDLDNINFDPGNLGFADPWSGYYAGIYRANVAIQGISGMTLAEPTKSRLLGENKFLRAYFYFFLVRGWGGVPLITSPLSPSEFRQQRATREEVYAQIEQDLTEAIAALPTEYTGGDVGRVTKGAAQAMLAEVHLYQGEYAQALARAQEVISSGKYSLFSNYETLFRREGENQSESVWEVQSVALEAGGAGSQYSEVQGVRGTPNIGWGFNTPAPELEDAYEPGDPRLQATIMYPWERLPDGTDRVVYLNPSMPNNRYNQKVFLSPETPRGSGNGGNNIRRIRYAHVLLTAAEAAARSSNEGQARTWLNLVRQRARMGRNVTIGAYEEEMAPRMATRLGAAIGASRVFVRHVDESDAAYAAGLRSFTSECAIAGCPSRETGANNTLPVRVTNMDVIQTVNGTPVTTLASYYAALNGIGVGTPVVLTVLRATQTVTDNTTGAATTTVTPLTVTITAQALLPDVTATGQALLDAIWAERRAELGMEQHRWFDLVRQGPARAQAVFQAQGKVFDPAKHVLFPIPAGEVAIAGLTQNPGY